MLSGYRRWAVNAEDEQKPKKKKASVQYSMCNVSKHERQKQK